jgi:chromosome segregation ATPase
VTLLNADLHAQYEARETLEAQLIEAQAELEASRARRKEMARVITNRDQKIQRLYEELAALQRHMVRSSPSGQMKTAFRRIGRALRRPARQTA